MNITAPSRTCLGRLSLGYVQAQCEPERSTSSNTGMDRVARLSLSPKNLTKACSALSTQAGKTIASGMTPASIPSSPNPGTGARAPDDKYVVTLRCQSDNLDAVRSGPARVHSFSK